VIISLVFLISHVFPPAVPSPREIFGQACVQSCQGDNDRAFCQRFCDCVINQTQSKGMFDDVFAGRKDQSDPQMQEIAGICTQEGLQQ
jgi:uncharacterized membrane protein